MSEEQDPAPGGAAAAGAVDPTADVAGLDKGMAEIRSLLQRTATAIGAIATAVVAGLGYARLHEYFPIPRNLDWWSYVLPPLALLLALGGSAVLASRFFRAQRRILLTTRLDAGDLDPEDEVIALGILNEHAAEEGAGKLEAVELRALRLGRIARQLARPHTSLPNTDESRSKAISAEASRLHGVVAIALARAAATILEDRARRVFRGWRTGLALGCAVAGIVGLFVFADYYKGERDLFELREKCIKAEEAGVVGACAAFETIEELTARRTEEVRDDVRAALRKTRARRTQEQKRLLRAWGKCFARIREEFGSDLSGEERYPLVALCTETLAPKSGN